MWKFKEAETRRNVIMYGLVRITPVLLQLKKYMENTTDAPISLDTNTSVKTSSNSSCIRDPENFIDSQVDFVRKKKPVEENNLHTCQQLFLSQ